VKQPKLTEWFDGEVRPGHVGVYQRDFSVHRTGTDVAPCLWDGRQWMVWGDTVQEAAHTSMPSQYQGLPWRGLAQQPKGGAR
jgi:hypothetical protein